jgi:hypothetical protein
MMRCCRLLLLMGLLYAGSPRAIAQGIDSVFVEIYNVQPDASNPTAPPLITYRIWVDLAPDYRLQMLYGDAHHQLMIATTTDFFNDKENGAAYGDKVNDDQLNSYPAALDSWLTISAASNRHLAIPRSMDKDGSILTCPPYPGRSVSAPDQRSAGSPPLCSSDGLMEVDSVREVVTFTMDGSYLDRIRGSVIRTLSGAWAVLGGTKGVTDRNLVLIAQITTTGELSYALNIQLGTPDHQILKCVASDPGPGEVLVPSLVHGQLSHH